MEQKCKHKIALLIGSSAALLLIALVCFALFLNPQRTYTITETYRIDSALGSDTYLNVCLPVSGGYQEVTDMRVEGVKDYSVANYDGWSELTARVPSNDTETLVTISYSVKLTRNALAWEGDVFDAYIQPQQYVDSNNNAVIRQAEQLRGNSDYETARNTLSYVHKTMRSPSDNQEDTVQLPASELLESPVGVCYDNAILMTALLRANGIPTRVISGLVLEIPLGNEGDWSHPGGAHAWVEFYADGRWHFADPTWGIFEKSDTEHLSYGTYEAYVNSAFQQDRYQAIEKSGYHLNGAMSAPLMFTLYSTDESATIIPRAHVDYSWFW